MDSAVWGLIGTLVGALASIGTTFLTTRNAHRLQANAKENEHIERANAFQRQTLIDLQEALHDALRLTTQGHMQDCEAHKGGMGWGKNMLDEPVNEDFRLAQRRVAILIERISEDGLRARIKGLMSLTVSVLLAQSEAEARSNMMQCYSAATEVMESVGTVLRRHY